LLQECRELAVSAEIIYARLFQSSQVRGSTQVLKASLLQWFDLVEE
jgi:hypothetical protein